MVTETSITGVRDSPTTATAPLASEQEGRPERRRHSQAPRSPHSNQKKLSHSMSLSPTAARRSQATPSHSPRLPLSTISVPGRKPHSPTPRLSRRSKRKAAAPHHLVVEELNLRHLHGLRSHGGSHWEWSVVSRRQRESAAQTVFEAAPRLVELIVVPQWAQHGSPKCPEPFDERSAWMSSSAHPAPHSSARRPLQLFSFGEKCEKKKKKP